MAFPPLTTETSHDRRVQRENNWLAFWGLVAAMGVLIVLVGVELMVVEDTTSAFMADLLNSLHLGGTVRPTP